MTTRTPQDRRPPKIQPKRTKPKQDIRLFKAVIQVVLAERNEKGEVVREIPTEAQILYVPDFPNFMEKMQQAEVDVKKQLAAQMNGSG